MQLVLSAENSELFGMELSEVWARVTGPVKLPPGSDVETLLLERFVCAWGVGWG